MHAVDTNVLVRLVARDNPEQVRIAEAFVAPGAWVSHLVLAEVVWVLEAVYDRTSEQIALAVEMLLDHKSLSIQDAAVVTSALEIFRSYPALGFSDCMMVEIARKAGHVSLGTFDRGLAKVNRATRL